MIGYAILHCLGACDGAYHGNFLLDLFGTLRSKWVKVDPWDQNRENIFLHGMSRDFCILFLGFQVHGTGHHRKVSAVRMFFELDLASLHHHLPLFFIIFIRIFPIPGCGSLYQRIGLECSYWKCLMRSASCRSGTCAKPFDSQREAGLQNQLRQCSML